MSDGPIDPDVPAKPGPVKRVTQGVVHVYQDTNPKVSAATVAAAGVTLVTWVAVSFFDVPVTVEAQGAATTLAVALAGWFKSA